MTDRDPVIESRDILAEGAQFALETSKRLCSTKCASYHGVWLFTRLFGILPAVRQDKKYFAQAIRRAAESGSHRVLISGAADFGILEFVDENFRDVQPAPDITVLDLCETTLAVNAWYAKRKNLRVSTIKANILDLETGSFDLVLAHNFLNFFGPDDHDVLFAKWASLLDPGGQLIIANNIKPGAPTKARRFGEARTEELINRMLQARLELGHEDLIEAEELERLLRDYARRRVSWKINNLDSLVDRFSGAGLEIVRIDESPYPKDRVHGDHTGRRFVITARKPL